MSIEMFNEMRRNSTTEDVIVSLIKAKSPYIRKIRKGRYELIDDDGNVIARTKGLRV